jgi:hypothetical protein
MDIDVTWGKQEKEMGVDTVMTWLHYTIGGEEKKLKSKVMRRFNKLRAKKTGLDAGGRSAGGGSPEATARPHKKVGSFLCFCCCDAWADVNCPSCAEKNEARRCEK